MTENGDLLIFTEDQTPAVAQAQKAWNILISDDDEEIHVVTKLVLNGVMFEGHPINFLSAASAAETIPLLDQWGEKIAIAILDVVMESEHSGLDLVKYIRETQKNQATRIILRTGQPGQAPERTIITSYDINDYKEKAELTSQKLFSSVFSALRSYRDIVTIDRSKRGLENIIKASHPLFKMEHSLEAFAVAVLDQLSSLLHTDESLLYIKHQSFAAISCEGEFRIITGTPEFRPFLHHPITDIAERHIIDLLLSAIRQQASNYYTDEYVGYFRSKQGVESVLYLKTASPISELDKHLVDVFSTNITLAFDNIMLNQDIIDTQKEILYTIGDVVETRSHETANHVNRVSKYSVLCGRLLGLSEGECELLQNASPMHDLGKIGIPDSIMIKPAALDHAEIAIMRNHTVIGWEILNRSNRKILQAAATISLQHHENWDGSGYPNRLAGEQIDIFARITAITDVFDALSHRRIYKDAWPLDMVKKYIQSRRGTQFDPALTDLFIAHWDEFVAIMLQNPDQPGR
jgi:response regulator RpfG family c-di-GMP phosphodiesterase